MAHEVWTGDVTCKNNCDSNNQYILKKLSSLSFEN